MKNANRNKNISNKGKQKHNCVTLVTGEMICADCMEKEAVRSSIIQCHNCKQLFLKQDLYKHNCLIMATGEMVCGNCLKTAVENPLVFVCNMCSKYFLSENTIRIYRGLSSCEDCHELYAIEALDSVFSNIVDVNKSLIEEGKNPLTTEQYIDYLIKIVKNHMQYLNPRKEAERLILSGWGWKENYRKIPEETILENEDLWELFYCPDFFSDCRRYEIIPETLECVINEDARMRDS